MQTSSTSVDHAAICDSVGARGKGCAAMGPQCERAQRAARPGFAGLEKALLVSVASCYEAKQIRDVGARR